MSKEDKSIIHVPQPNCPVNFEILAANVRAVEESSKIGNRSNSPLCKRECLVKINHAGYTHITRMNI